MAWCALRENFRMFRIDRIRVLDPLQDRFPRDPTRSLAACMTSMEAREGRHLPDDPLG